MPLDNQIIKQRGESFGDYVYSLMKKDVKFESMNYGEFMLALDHMYAQISIRIHEDLNKQ